MLFPFDNPIIFLTTHCNMLCGLGASTFLFSIVSNNFNSFNNTWHKPVVEAGVAVVRSTLRCQVSVRIMPQVFYARRNRRNSPSMARFLLASASMPRHFCALQHNSTVTKQLRYSPARQHRLPHLLPPLTLRLNVPVLICGSFGTVLSSYDASHSTHFIRRKVCSVF